MNGPSRFCVGAFRRPGPVLAGTGDRWQQFAKPGPGSPVSERSRIAAQQSRTVPLDTPDGSEIRKPPENAIVKRFSHQREISSKCDVKLEKDSRSAFSLLFDLALRRDRPALSRTSKVSSVTDGSC